MVIIMNITTLVENIKLKTQEKTPFLVAIDGRCGSGKSTLGGELQKIFDCNLFQMDDFYLRPEQRTPERYAEPGGNVDYERFLEDVLVPVRDGIEFSYRPFDCNIWNLGEAVQASPHAVNIVEGSYSLHPLLREFYDYKIFLDISKEEQMRRIVRRNGEEKALEFRDRWIPLEELYFAKYNVHELCDYVWGKDENIIF